MTTLEEEVTRLAKTWCGHSEFSDAPPIALIERKLEEGWEAIKTVQRLSTYIEVW